MNKEEICTNCVEIEVPSNITDHELIFSYQFSQYIQGYVRATIEARVQTVEVSQEFISRRIDEVLEQFYEMIEPELIEIRDNPPVNANKNVFTFSDTMFLSKANDYTRVISTKFGNTLEKIAQISPKCFSTEAEFSMKLKGVDLIILDANELVYTQLKTQKNTLTAGKTGSVIKELSVFENSMFVACLDLASWTFSPRGSEVIRVSGEEFWSRIDIPYETLCSKIKDLFGRIENILAT